MDNMLEGCQIIDFDWKYIYLNEAAALDGRTSKNKLLGHTMMECFPGIENTPLFSILKECMEKRTAKRFDNEFIFPDGSCGWFTLSVQPIQEGLFILSLDVTDMKKAADVVRQREAELSSALKIAKMVIWSIDLRTKELKTSSNFSEFFDLHTESGAITFEMFLCRVHPDDRYLMDLNRYTFHENQEPLVFDFRIVMPDQSIRWIQDSLVPVYDQGKLIVLKGTNIDITDKKIQEEEIRRMNETLEQRIEERTAELSDLYNNAPCGYHSLDADGTIQRMNDTELNWLGYEREELVGKMKAVDILTESSRNEFYELFSSFRKNRFIKDVELEFLCKDGHVLPILLNATAIYNKDGHFLHSRSTTIDNSDRKRAEESLKAALNNLESVNKELEAFSYSVSHDLRSPLRAISGFTQILMENYESVLDDEARRICGVIQDNAKKMGRLIDDLLSFSRFSRSELKLTRLNMGIIVKTVIDELMTAENTDRIKITLKPLPDIRVDVSLIKQVWINLISNAVKYTSRREIAEITISAALNDPEVFFSISDNGIGFDMNYAHHLFGVFQRLHSESEFEGTGVGLAIVKRIITRHGGRVWAQGYPNEGAVFGFSLPCNIVL